jgi:hypothetical protein
MSHLTTIQTQVRDIAALRDACQELGLQVVAFNLERAVQSRFARSNRFSCPLVAVRCAVRGHEGVFTRMVRTS